MNMIIVLVSLALVSTSSFATPFNDFLNNHPTYGNRIGTLVSSLLGSSSNGQRGSREMNYKFKYFLENDKLGCSDLSEKLKTERLELEENQNHFDEISFLVESYGANHSEVYKYFAELADKYRLDLLTSEQDLVWKKLGAKLSVDGSDMRVEVLEGIMANKDCEN